jgi:hypothetical protein
LFTYGNWLSAITHSHYCRFGLSNLYQMIHGLTWCLRPILQSWNTSHPIKTRRLKSRDRVNAGLFRMQKIWVLLHNCHFTLGQALNLLWVYVCTGG